MTGDGVGGPYRVLLVEDNPGDARLVREAFAESGFDTSLTTVTDGEAALDYLLLRDEYESAPRPDLALLDLNVPKVNGKAVLEEVGREPELESVPIVVLSSSKTRDAIRDTYELGADGYYVKPVAPNEFFSLVQTLERSLATQGRVPRGEFADLDVDP